MFCKMCVTVAMCLVFLLAFSEGFFIPSSLRKQPDCVRRAPQSAAFNSPQWGSTSTSGNTNGGSAIYVKDFSSYPQQQPQQQHQQSPHNQHLQQAQYQQPQQTQQYQQHQLYPSQQLQNVQATAPKYEPTPFQSINQPQYSYEGIYQTPLNSYSQGVQLVPCLCPVNKEMIEQQNQQLQQQSSLSASPTPSSLPADPNSSGAAPPPPPPPQTNQKKNS